jgi:hypothetical protein
MARHVNRQLSRERDQTGQKTGNGQTLLPAMGKDVRHQQMHLWQVMPARFMSSVLRGAVAASGVP